MNDDKLRGELFDEHVDRYAEELSAALSASGESREYFAEGRVEWLAQCLARAGESPRALLDFGCGDGSTAPLLLSVLRAESVFGLDVSERSVAIARERHGNARISYGPLREFQPAGDLDLAYSNGVFHHVPIAERAGALATVMAALRPGGFFALWENNGWNPATRYVMSRCAFDRDAILLTPPEARALLRERGFEVVRTDFLFIFPRTLRFLRPLENALHGIPLGTQYQILCRKPGSAASGA